MFKLKTVIAASLSTDKNLHINKVKTKTVCFFFSFFFIKANAQCAMCRAVLESEEGLVTAKSINDGIIYLAAIPYILVFGVAYYIYRKYFKVK